MPIGTDYQAVPMMGNVINVPIVDNKVGVTVQMQKFDGTDADMDAILLSLVDLLQGWSYRQADQNVTGQKYVTGYYNVTPTNLAEDHSLPPENPPGEGQG